MICLDFFLHSTLKFIIRENIELRVPFGEMATSSFVDISIEIKSLTNIHDIFSFSLMFILMSLCYRSTVIQSMLSSEF